MYLFVYGTLKQGRSNHGLIDHCEKVGQFHTSKDYSLIVSGLPFLVERKGVGTVGEVYKIDKETLHACDRLEGHPSFYQRKTITVTSMEDGNDLEVYAYIHPDIFNGKGYHWDYEVKREF